MLRVSALWLGLCPTLIAATPGKDDLPKGALARLGSVATPAEKGSESANVDVLAFADEWTLFVGTSTGLQTWDLAKRQSLQERPISVPAYSLARDRDRAFIGSAGKLHLIEPLESVTLRPARSLDSAAETIDVLAMAPHGGRLVYADGPRKLGILDPRTGKVTGVAEFASQPIAASMTANGRILGVVTRDGASRVYGLSANGSLEPLWTRRLARSERIAAQFSPDGRLFAVSSAGRVMVLDAFTGRPMKVIERRFGEGDVRCLAFSPDGQQLAIGSYGPEAVARVSEVATGAEQATFRGHVGDIHAVAFSPDGRVLASGGGDRSVFLWRVPLPNPSSPVTTTAEAWDTLDAIDSDVAYRAMGCLLAHPGRAVTVIGEGFKGVADEQARIRRWLAELDHDEFRVREAARRSLLKVGLRAAAALNDPSRKKMGIEGETRVRLILETMESRGLRIPESGLFGEPLRMIRGVRVLETIGSPAARAVLEDAAKGPPHDRLTREARAALETLPAKPR